MYESPINMIVNDITSNIQEKEDKYIMECVRNVDITVDKEELVKALQYDRQQYDKGYEDGYADGMRSILHEIIESSKPLDDIIEEYKDLIEEDK